MLGCQQYLCCNEINKEVFVECDTTKLKCYKNTDNSICICNEGNVAFKIDDRKIRYFKSDSTSITLLDSSSFKDLLLPKQCITYAFIDESEGIYINGKKEKIFFIR